MTIRVGLRHMARILWTRLMLKKAGYGGITPPGGYHLMAQWPGVDVLANVLQIYLMFDGVSVLGGTLEYAQMGGISVEQGTA